MKKIIKITALILALLCISTSIASCGKKETNNDNLNDLSTQINQEENLKFLADQIKNNITLTIDTIDYVDKNNSFSLTYQASEILSNENHVSDYLKEYNIADINKMGTYFLLDEHTGLIKLRFWNARYFESATNKAKTTITIYLPIETVNVSYNDTIFDVTLSPDKRSIIVEYIFDPSSDTHKSALINSDIYIFY